MHFNPDRYRKVKNFISYLASQSNSLKTMAKNKRTIYDVSIALLAAEGMLNKLLPHYYFMLREIIMDYTNPLLDHPGLDEQTRSRVHEIRSSALDMDLKTLAKTIKELERIKKLLR